MDDKLNRALRSLPRTEARPGFTEAVQRRLGERRRRDLRRLVSVRMAVAAACLLLLVLGAREWVHHHRRQQAAVRLAALESERRALAAELESLRRQLAMAQPVVYLGGNNDLDLVLDLAELQRAGLRPEDFRARLPTSTRSDGPRSDGPRHDGPRPTGLRPALFEHPQEPTIY